MTRKAVVFGGSGFIGSHVADLLSMDGYSVTIFDEVRSPWLRSDQNFITGDITKKVDVDLVIEGASVVYNFAALVTTFRMNLNVKFACIQSATKT